MLYWNIPVYQSKSRSYNSDKDAANPAGSLDRCTNLQFAFVENEMHSSD